MQWCGLASSGEALSTSAYRLQLEKCPAKLHACLMLRAAAVQINGKDADLLTHLAELEYEFIPADKSTGKVGLPKEQAKVASPTSPTPSDQPELCRELVIGKCIGKRAPPASAHIPRQLAGAAAMLPGAQQTVLGSQRLVSTSLLSTTFNPS